MPKLREGLKRFVSALVNGMEVHGDKVRVALISFNRGATVHFDFNTAVNGGKAAVLDAIAASDFGVFQGQRKHNMAR